MNVRKCEDRICLAQTRALHYKNYSAALKGEYGYLYCLPNLHSVQQYPYQDLISVHAAPEPPITKEGRNALKFLLPET